MPSPQFPRTGDDTNEASTPRSAAWRPRVARYALSAAAWLAALGLTLLLAPYIERANFVFFWVAVLFAAWYAGLAAALVVAVASMLAVQYYLVPPRGFGSLANVNFYVFAIFASAAAMVSALTARVERERRTANARFRELEALNDQLRQQQQLLEEQTGELESQTEEAEVLTEELAETNVRLEEVAREAEQARARTVELLDSERLAVDRARRLLTVATGLSEATTPEEVADVIFTEGLRAIGADAGTLALVVEGPSGREFETVRTHGYPPELVTAYRRFPVHPGRPLSDAILGGAPRLMETWADWQRQYPDIDHRVGATGYEGFAAIPVMTRGRALAAISASFRKPVTFDDATRTFLASIGEQCGLALERARAYEAERDAREFSAGILSSILDAFFALDPELRFLYVNERAVAMLRKPASELLGQRMWEVFPGAEHSEFGAAFERVLQSGTPETLEGYSNIVGSWIETRLYPSARGLSVFFQDVSARRRSQETSAFLVEASRLLNASLDYETTLAALADAAVPRLGDWCAVDIRRDPTTSEWPPVLDRLAVVHRDPAMVALGMELTARYPTDWSADAGMAGVYRTATPLFLPVITEEIIAAGARSEEHHRLLRELKFSSIIVVPLVARGLMLGSLTLCMSDSGRRYDDGDLALAQDLAQRAATAVDNARLYREAERARAEAEESNRAKGLFLTTMSHELRTPLNAIAGYVDLLDMELRGPITEAQREDLGRVRRSAKTLMALVNDVLNFARIEAAQVDYRIEELLVDPVLADLDLLVRPQVEAKQLHYDHVPCLEPLRVRADPDRLKQILTNLLTNAIKFTEPGGHIVLGCEPTADGRRVRIMVRDTGRGIPQEQLERIFEPFVQVDRHLSPDSQQGVGLGLAISRDLALGMHGELRADSTPGVGSTFTLFLPRA